MKPYNELIAAMNHGRMEIHAQVHHASNDGLPTS